MLLYVSGVCDVQVGFFLRNKLKNTFFLVFSVAPGQR